LLSYLLVTTTLSLIVYGRLSVPEARLAMTLLQDG